MRLDFPKHEFTSVDHQHDEVEKTFWATFQTNACAAFHTVLGPGADAFHQNHVHVDLEPRGRNGDTKYCH